MSTPGPDPKITLNYPRAQPELRHTRLALAASTLGAAALFFAWLCVGCLLIHKPWFKDIRSAIHLAYTIVFGTGLLAAAAAIVELIIYYNNQQPQSAELRKKGLAMALLGAGMTLASYVVFHGMAFWLQGGHIAITRIH